MANDDDKKPDSKEEVTDAATPAKEESAPATEPAPKEEPAPAAAEAAPAEKAPAAEAPAAEAPAAEAPAAEAPAASEETPAVEAPAASDTASADKPAAAAVTPATTTSPATPPAGDNYRGGGGNFRPGGPGGRGPGGRGPGGRGSGGRGRGPGGRGPGGRGRGPGGPRGGGGFDDDQNEISEKVVFINRCAKVVKGGRRFSFSALVVTGDHKGKVGWGFGKAQEVAECIRKASEYSKNKMVKVPMNGTTIPHEILGVHGGGRVLLRPASPGTGIIAGGSVRSVLEAAGYKDVLTKSLGSNNHANVVKATLNGLQNLRTKDEIYALRGKKVAEKKAL